MSDESRIVARPSGRTAWVASVTTDAGTESDTSPSTKERSEAVTGCVDWTWTPRAPSFTAVPRIALRGTRVTEPGGTRTSSRPSGRNDESSVTTRITTRASSVPSFATTRARVPLPVGSPSRVRS